MIIINERKLIDNKDKNINKIYSISLGKFNKSKKETNNNILKINHVFSITIENLLLFGDNFVKFNKNKTRIILKNKKCKLKNCIDLKISDRKKKIIENEIIII